MDPACSALLHKTRKERENPLSTGSLLPPSPLLAIGSFRAQQAFRSLARSDTLPRAQRGGSQAWVEARKIKSRKKGLVPQFMRRPSSLIRSEASLDARSAVTMKITTFLWCQQVTQPKPGRTQNSIVHARGYKSRELCTNCTQQACPNTLGSVTYSGMLVYTFGSRRGLNVRGLRFRCPWGLANPSTHSVT